MIPSLLRRITWGALALALAAPASVAQTMDPATHILKLAKGESAVITVKTDCPSFIKVSVDDATPNIAELSDTDDQKPVTSVKVKVTAKANTGAAGYVRFDIQPIDGTCGDPQLLVATIFVVADTKPIEKLLKQGIKKAEPPLPGASARAKAMRQDIQQIVAAHRLVVKTVLQQLKNGAVTVPPVIPPPPGEAPPPPPGLQLDMTQSERALTAISLSEFTALDRLEASYWTFLAGLNDNAGDLLTLAGLAASTAFTAPRDFQPNTGGQWDQERLRAVAAMKSAVGGIDASSQQAMQAVEGLSRQRDETLFVRSRGLSLPDPGNGGATPLSGPTITETQNMGISILAAKAWNGPTVGGADLSNGRIQISARLAGSGAFVQFQRINVLGQPIGDPQGDSFVTDADAHQLFVLWPPADDPPTLAQGTWRVIIQGGGGSLAYVQVVVPVD